jgi:uncharacterized coiled-coil protein SlyX
MASEIKAVGQDKTPERLLAEAEKRIKMLEAKVAEQQKTIRDLRSQIRQDNNQAEQISELKSELGELKGELKEITRANHEFVARYETTREELAKSKGDVRGSGKSAPAARISGRTVPEAVAA